jgi:hypothetical protein
VIALRTVGIAARVSAAMLRTIATTADSVIAQSTSARPDSPPQAQSKAPSLQYAAFVA